MYNKNMGSLRGLAHGFKTMCKAFQATHGFIVHGLGGFAHGIKIMCKAS